jgi:hypothetical protein
MMILHISGDDEDGLRVLREYDTRVVQCLVSLDPEWLGHTPSEMLPIQRKEREIRIRMIIDVLGVTFASIVDRYPYLELPLATFGQGDSRMRR